MLTIRYTAYNLLTILRPSPHERCRFAVAEAVQDTRLAQHAEKMHITWSATDVSDGAGVVGHVDGYVIGRDKIMLACGIRGDYRCCPRTMALAVAQRIVRRRFPGYTVHAVVLCSDPMKGVTTVALDTGVAHEADKFLRQL